MPRPRRAPRPAGERAIFISDSGDNPTAGSIGDVPYFLGRLLAHPHFGAGAGSAIYASIPDPGAVEACLRAGPGRDVRLSLGGKLDPLHGRPLDLRGTVTALLRDDPVGGDMTPSARGASTPSSPPAGSRSHRVRDLLALGLDPARHHVTAVKIGYLVPDLRAASGTPCWPSPPGRSTRTSPGSPPAA